MTVNYGFVFAAALASYAFGAAYYTALSKPWMAALETTQAAIDARHKVVWLPFAVTFVAHVVMAYLFAGVLVHLVKGGLGATARSGLITALFLWAGFVITTMASNNSFRGSRWMLTVIDGGHWLGVLLIQGLIIGAYGLSMK
jgi:Protein of unknown function (DUF1761)